MADTDQKAEKPLHVESRIDPRYDLTALTTEDAEFLASFSEEARKRVIWKVGNSVRRLCMPMRLTSASLLG